MVDENGQPYCKAKPETIAQDLNTTEGKVKESLQILKDDKRIDYKSRTHEIRTLVSDLMLTFNPSDFREQAKEIEDEVDNIPSDIDDTEISDTAVTDDDDTLKIQRPEVIPAVRKKEVVTLEDGTKFQCNIDEYELHDDRGKPQTHIEFVDSYTEKVTAKYRYLGYIPVEKLVIGRQYASGTHDEEIVEIPLEEVEKEDYKIVPKSDKDT